MRPIPAEWATLRRLQLVVSIDGLQPEHDVRRTPATYDRILKHIVGHKITVHCTITRQQVQRDGYLEEFLRFWQANEQTRSIWLSLYTPQKGEISAERLRRADRVQVVADLRRLRTQIPKLQLPDGLLNVYARTAGLARGVHLRPDDELPVVGPRTQRDRAVPVRRESRLLELRLHRLRGARGGRPPSAHGRHPGRENLLCLAGGRPHGRAAA